MADPALLLDSHVLIDLFRGSPQAADWVSANSDVAIGIPVIVRGVLWLPQETETVRGRV